MQVKKFAKNLTFRGTKATWDEQKAPRTTLTRHRLDRKTRRTCVKAPRCSMIRHRIGKMQAIRVGVGTGATGRAHLLRYRGEAFLPPHNASSLSPRPRGGGLFLCRAR